MQKFSHWLTPIIALFFAVALSATAASTIGTNIVTDGNLEVTGTATTTNMYVSDVFATADAGTLYDGVNANYLYISGAIYGPTDLSYIDFPGTDRVRMKNDSGDGLDVTGNYVEIFSSGASNYISLSVTSGGYIDLSGSRIQTNDPVVIKQTGTLSTCNATIEGAIQYDDENNEFCGCNGTSWSALDGAGSCI